MVYIVLFEFEILLNMVNIIRICFVIGVKLYIIKFIFFSLDFKYLFCLVVGRFLSDIEYEVYDLYFDFYNKYKDKNIYYIIRYGFKIYIDVNFKKEYEDNEEIWLMFGKEFIGIDK